MAAQDEEIRLQTAHTSSSSQGPARLQEPGLSVELCERLRQTEAKTGHWTDTSTAGTSGSHCEDGTTDGAVAV